MKKRSLETQDGEGRHKLFREASPLAIPILKNPFWIAVLHSACRHLSIQSYEQLHSLSEKLVTLWSLFRFVQVQFGGVELMCAYCLVFDIPVRSVALHYS